MNGRKPLTMLLVKKLRREVTLGSAPLSGNCQDYGSVDCRCLSSMDSRLKRVIACWSHLSEQKEARNCNVVRRWSNRHALGGYFLFLL